MKVLSTKDVSVLADTSISTAAKWARANGVAVTNGGNRGSTYLWTEADLERFKGRNKQRGKPAHKKK